MPNSDRFRRFLHVPFLLTVLIASCLLAPSDRAQEPAPEMPDLAAMEAQFEDMFAHALEQPESDPLVFNQTWGAVIMSALMLDRARAMAEGTLDNWTPASGLAAADRTLERWRRARPESPGPDLMHIARLQDQDERRTALLHLLEEYPDDYLVLHGTWSALRQARQTERATALLEDYLARHPERAKVYSLLLQESRDNATRSAEILHRWAAVAPDDGELVQAWLNSHLKDQEPVATAALLSELFSRRELSAEVFSACQAVERAGITEFVPQARACIARAATDPGLPSWVTSAATQALASIAAKEGDWSRLAASLETLEPEQKLSALTAAAGGLREPEQCGDRIAVLQSTRDLLAEAEDGYRRVASALRPCFGQPAADAFFLELLRQAPADQVAGFLQSVRGNGVLRADHPEGTRKVLERRLEREPESTGLFRILDTVYETEGEHELRLSLLKRWWRLDPQSMWRVQVIALAEGLAFEGEVEQSIGVLEQHLEARWSDEASDLLWGLYAQAEGLDRADRFADELMAAEDSGRVTAGHRLAARSALLRDDGTAAENHYWEALRGEQPRPEVAAEMLAALNRGPDPERQKPHVRETAFRLCRETELAQRWPDETQCVAGLLSRAGLQEIAAELLAAPSGELPDDPEALRAIAQTARQAGRLELAERALRRALELDPRSETSWTSLAGFLEEQGRVAELEDLLARSATVFPTPPGGLLRATGRALSAAGRPQRALELLQAAREALPEGSRGDYSRSWIDHEIRQAYALLGRPQPEPRAARSAPLSPVPAELADATAADLRTAAEALNDGSGGRYDPDLALSLLARAAEKGDLLAVYRLALRSRLHPQQAPPGAEVSDDLYRRAARHVQDLASEGDGYAEYLLGTAALAGLDGGEDFAAARRWLQSAAQQDVGWAWHNLAWMQETGRGYPAADAAAAVDLYRRASQLGNASSMYDLARLTLTFAAHGPQCDEGLHWLERSARTGQPRSIALLGKLLLYGRGRCIEAAPTAAVPWLEAGQAAGEPGAGCDLGLALLVGEDAAGHERALGLLRQAADEHDPLAADTLAFLYASGLRVPRDAARAGRWTTEAVRLGSDGFASLRQSGLPRLDALLGEGLRKLEVLAAEEDVAATALLARLRYSGLGDPTEPARVLALARFAAARGEASAMRTLAHAYQSGYGVDEDAAESLRWMRRGAEAGDSFCMMFYSQALRDGKGVEQDAEAGLDWLMRSAETGNWWAVGEVARLYADGGHDVARDPDTAAAWWRLRARLGDLEARGWLAFHGYELP